MAFSKRSCGGGGSGGSGGGGGGGGGGAFAFGGDPVGFGGGGGGFAFGGAAVSFGGSWVCNGEVKPCKSSSSAANAGIDRCYCGQCNYSLCDGCVDSQCGITEDAFARMSAEAHEQQDARIKAPYIEVRKKGEACPML